MEDTDNILELSDGAIERMIAEAQGTAFDKGDQKPVNIVHKTAPCRPPHETDPESGKFPSPDSDQTANLVPASMHTKTAAIDFQSVQSEL